jgi:predicted nucleic acid-binding protein
MSSVQRLDRDLLVLDTNIVLDLLLFQDPRTMALRTAVNSGAHQWLATAHMRNELERVLTYANIQDKLTAYLIQASEILQQFDRLASLWSLPCPKAAYSCKDTDDQPFIDLACALAVAHPSNKVRLLSKDKAVLAMRKHMAKLSVFVSMTICD